eukprot:CAMPEP_0167746170 /NCGR_PEP_ID=MMETSP0110_2-20121227/3563_1 /TAXON_ID=629695 /ORGANISM="Gymnochlora sp., Strain CCMP2014" /LENGTH=364 /DNA_ID=CAMNT_0007630903 /DNA_START=116 /DNA_END=1206 /DNA_ORIENTATION=-
MEALMKKYTEGPHSNVMLPPPRHHDLPPPPPKKQEQPLPPKRKKPCFQPPSKFCPQCPPEPCLRDMPDESGKGNTTKRGTDVSLWGQQVASLEQEIGGLLGDIEQEFNSSLSSFVEMGQEPVVPLCEICLFVIDSKLQGKAFLCRGLDDAPEMRGCEMVMESMMWWIENVAYWAYYGCPRYTPKGTRWAYPCPARVQCHFMKHLYRRISYCPADKEFIKPKDEISDDDEDKVKKDEIREEEEEEEEEEDLEGSRQADDAARVVDDAAVESDKAKSVDDEARTQKVDTSKDDDEMSKGSSFRAIHGHEDNIASIHPLNPKRIQRSRRSPRKNAGTIVSERLFENSRVTGDAKWRSGVGKQDNGDG